MFRRILAAAGALLVLFHLWLFAGQMWAGDLADAALLGRWAAAGGLTVALLVLRRQGASLVRGRRAVAIWLLAALLHAPAVVDRIDAPAPAVPDAVAVLASVSVAVLGAGLLLLAALLAAVAPVRTVRRARPVTARAVFITPTAFPLLAPRPPPAA